MNVSILICSKGRRKDLSLLVEQVKALQTSVAFEIVVVEETDQPAPIKGVHYFAHPESDRGIPYARNLALEQASGDIVVFVDDDCLVHEKWLDRLVSPFDDESIVAVQGGVTVPRSTNAIGWAESVLGFPGGGIRRILDAQEMNRKTIEVSTLNCAYRKWVVDKIGGFDESLKFGGEDYLLAKQASRYGCCLFVPGAFVEHSARGSLVEIWHWFVRRGRAEIGVMRNGKYNKFNFKALVMSSLLVKIIALAAAGLAFPTLAVLLIPTAAVGYLVLQYLRFFKSWKIADLSLSSLAVLPLVKLIMDFAADLGRIKGLLVD